MARLLLHIPDVCAHTLGGLRYRVNSGPCHQFGAYFGGDFWTASHLKGAEKREQLLSRILCAVTRVKSLPYPQLTFSIISITKTDRNLLASSPPQCCFR